MPVCRHGWGDGGNQPRLNQTLVLEEFLGYLIRGTALHVDGVGQFRHAFIGKPAAQQIQDLLQIGGGVFHPVSYTHLDVYKRQPQRYLLL